MIKPIQRWLAISWLIFRLVLAFVVLMPHWAMALTASQVYERVKDSIVVVKGYDQAGKMVGLGSGVVLPSGDIVTNYHVFKSGVRHAVVREGKAVPATVKAGDPKKDLCLLSAPGLAATPARLGQASRLKVGEPVYAVGAPQGLELSLSEGIVSQLRGGPPPIIQTTVAISKGSSGGGLFNAEGELVGITTFYVEGGQSLNFAVPVEWVIEVDRMADCLEYEPTTVKLSGKVLREVCPGLPNFESVERGDEKCIVWFLNLDKPLCVKGGENDPINIPVSNIKRVQLVLNSTQYKIYRTMVNNNVIVTGQLFHSYTGHHYAEVLLIVKTIEGAT
jgi:hypothetical protein